MPVHVPIYRLKLVKDRTVALPKVSIDHPQIAALLISRLIGRADREHLIALFLNSCKAIVGVHTIGVGTLTSVKTSIREVFKAGIVANASAIILGHNHPSTHEAEPSPQDVRFTKRLVLIGRYLDVPILDHVIVAGGEFCSMKELGIVDAPSATDAALDGEDRATEG